MNTNVAYLAGKQVRRGSESAKMHQKVEIWKSQLGNKTKRRFTRPGDISGIIAQNFSICPFLS